MKYVVLLCGVVAFFLSGCQPESERMSFDETNDTTEIFNPDIANSLKSPTIFNFDSVSGIPSLYKSVEAISEINFDDSTKIDTIVKFFNRHDTIIYAKANSGLFLWRMVMQASSIALNHGIFVSCNEEVFRSAFHLDTLHNVVSVWGEDGAETFYFTFEKDTLKKIEYEMHFEAVK